MAVMLASGKAIMSNNKQHNSPVWKENIIRTSMAIGNVWEDPRASAMKSEAGTVARGGGGRTRRDMIAFLNRLGSLRACVALCLL